MFFLTSFLDKCYNVLAQNAIYVATFKQNTYFLFPLQVTDQINESKLNFPREAAKQRVNKSSMLSLNRNVIWPWKSGNWPASLPSGSLRRRRLRVTSLRTPLCASRWWPNKFKKKLLTPSGLIRHFIAENVVNRNYLKPSFTYLHAFVVRNWSFLECIFSLSLFRINLSQSGYATAISTLIYRQELSNR